jgi:hypothetical protein
MNYLNIEHVCFIGRRSIGVVYGYLPILKYFVSLAIQIIRDNSGGGNATHKGGSMSFLVLK